MPLFNKFAQKYDLFNEVISAGGHKKVKESSVRQLTIPENAKILDLCTGTGDIAGFIKKIQPTAQIKAIDVSEEMLELAKTKYKYIDFVTADCTSLSFENESFDICTISFGLRNIQDREKALLEIYRVLKKDGVFLHLDFANSNNFADKVFNVYVWFLSKFFFKKFIPYEYFRKSKREFPRPDELIKMFETQGFLFEKKFDLSHGVISGQIYKK